MTQPVYRRALPLIGGLLVALLALSLVTSPSAEAAGALAAPTGFKVVARNHTNAEVKWKPVAHASSYKVVAATDKTMKHVAFQSKTGATYRWISGRKITDGRTYYVQVQAFRGAKAGRKSVVHSVTLKAHQVLRPTNVLPRPVSSTSLRVSWTKAKYATAYTVKFAAKVNSTPFAVKTVSGSQSSAVVTGIDLAKLHLPRTFFVSVTASRYHQTFRDSGVVPAALPIPVSSRTTAATNPAFALSVGSYNVRQSRLTTPSFPQVSQWPQRAAALARTIKAMNVDVLGVQETNWGTRGNRPVQQVASGSGMVVADVDANTPCGDYDLGIGLLYDPTVLHKDACGSYALTNASGDCCMEWGLFRNIATGGRVIVATTHLAVGAGAAWNRTRNAQTTALISHLQELERHYGVPAVTTGDLNTNYNSTATTPMALLSSAGFLGADLLAAKVSHYEAHSAHGFKPQPPNGVKIDHISVSAQVVARSFAVDVSNPRTAPSDHFPIQANLTVR